MEWKNSLLMIQQWWWWLLWWIKMASWWPMAIYDHFSYFLYSKHEKKTKICRINQLNYYYYLEVLNFGSKEKKILKNSFSDRGTCYYDENNNNNSPKWNRKTKQKQQQKMIYETLIITCVSIASFQIFLLFQITEMSSSKTFLNEFCSEFLWTNPDSEHENETLTFFYSIFFNESLLNYGCGFYC